MEAVYVSFSLLLLMCMEGFLGALKLLHLTVFHLCLWSCNILTLVAVSKIKSLFLISYSDGACIPKDNDFLSRLVETGATESSGCHLENNIHSSTTDVLQNVLFSLNDSWHANKKCPSDLFAALPENGLFRVHISLVIIYITYS